MTSSELDKIFKDWVQIQSLLFKSDHWTLEAQEMYCRDHLGQERQGHCWVFWVLFCMLLLLALLVCSDTLLLPPRSCLRLSATSSGSNLHLGSVEQLWPGLSPSCSKKSSKMIFFAVAYKSYNDARFKNCTSCEIQGFFWPLSFSVRQLNHIGRAHDWFLFLQTAVCLVCKKNKKIQMLQEAYSECAWIMGSRYWYCSYEGNLRAWSCNYSYLTIFSATWSWNGAPHRDKVKPWEQGSIAEVFGLLKVAKPVVLSKRAEPKAHVLVCAPSNSALDEIVIRILNSGITNRWEIAFLIPGRQLSSFVVSICKDMMQGNNMFWQVVNLWMHSCASSLKAGAEGQFFKFWP